MIPLNYHHLYYFWVVVKSGSITAARERLQLAQPTLSLQLAQLERSCGGRLLERTRQGVTVTPLGRQVFEHCERIFSEGEALASTLKAGTAPPSVRVGVEATVPREAVLTLLERARAWAPNVRLGLFTGAGGLIARVKRRSLDVVMTSTDPAAELGQGFRVRVAGESPLSFVVHKELARRGETLKQALSRLPLLLRPSGHPIREQTDAFLARQGVAAKIEGEVDDVEVLKRLVVGRRGAATLPQVAVADELAAGRLVRLHDKSIGIIDRQWLAGPATFSGTPEARELLAALMDKFSVN